MKRKILLLLILVCGSCYCQEICDNATDDDGDGLIDLNDPDCQCQPIVASLVPNPSFEAFDICPTDYSQLNNCSNWIQATGATTDYMNTCGFISQGVIQNGLTDFPDGEAIVAAIFQPQWKEYLGCCLGTPMLPGINYQLSFNVAAMTGSSGFCSSDIINFEPIDITLYGNPSCSSMPLSTAQSPNFADPSWVVIGSAHYEPVNAWGQLTIFFTVNEAVNAIMLGAPELLPPGYSLGGDLCDPYFLFDNLILNESSAFGVNVQQTGNYCSNTLALQAIPTTEVSGSQTYQWYRDGIAIVGATAATLAIPAVEGNLGEYKVRMVDGVLCKISLPQLINNQMQAPVAVMTAPICSTEGSITITTPAGLYSFDDGATWVAENVKSGLAPGTYYFKIRDESGCVSVAGEIVLPAVNVLPAPAYLVNDASCGATGSIEITSQAAEYSFDGGMTWTGSPAKDNLTGGFYTILVRDAAGCVSNAETVFVDQSLITAPDATFSAPTCSDNGVITITTPAAEYSINGGFTWATASVFQNLPPGNYDVVIRDAAGCLSAPKSLFLPSFIGFPTYVFQNPGCGSTGSITIQNTGIEYSINGGVTWQTTATFTGLGPGSYSLQFRYPEGCLSNPMTLNLFETLLNILPQVQVVPAGCVPGSITVTTPATQYSFDGGVTWQDNAVLANAAAGNYQVIIKDGQGCSSQTKPVQVGQNNDTLDAPDFSVTPASCGMGGSIQINSMAFQYSFDGGVSWGAANSISSLAPGIYSIMVGSETGCQSPAVEVAVAEIAVPPPTVTDLVYCQFMQVQPLSAAGDNLLWYTTQTGGAASQVAPIPSASVPGTSSFYVSQTVNGCESSRAIINVTVTGAPGIPVAAAEVTYCESSITFPLEAVGINLKWYTQAVGGTANAAAPVPSSISSGVVTYYVSQTQNGCESQRAAISVVVTAAPQAPQALSPVQYVVGAPAVALTATGQGLLWHDENFAILDQAPVPNTSISGIQVYYVSQVVNGCESPLVRVDVVVSPPRNTFDYPKFFTPNNDGFHDTWNINPGPGISTSTYIFDRYGKLLTSIASPGQGWDGVYNNHDLPATDYWFVTKYTENGIEKEFKAHFSLLR